MALSVEQIRKLIKEPANKKSVEKAQRHQERINFHAEAVESAEYANAYKNRFLSWVKNGLRLPNDKFEVFKELMRFPLPTTSLISSIFDEFTTIFTAQDSFRDYSFENPDFKSEFDEYLQSNNVQPYVAEHVFQMYKERHNSLLVIDLPSTQSTIRPEPYFYEISIHNVIDISVKEVAGQEFIRYIIFKIDDNHSACFDDTFFRVFVKNEAQNDILSNSLISSEWYLLTEVAHNLGFTPACFVSSYPLSTTERITRKSPLSESASDLDWLLFLKTAKRQYEIYGAFPIISTYESKCEFSDPKGNPCTSGHVAYLDENGMPGHYPCPVCKEGKSLVGPGTVITVPAPRSKEDADLGRTPVTITPPDISSLKNLTEEVDKVEWDIFTNIVGGVDGVLNKQAINEIQASAIVESKRKKYIYIASNFERVEKFIVDTFGRLMYPGYYTDSTINYGSQFDLYTSENVLAQLDGLKKSGAAQYLIDQKVNLFIQSDNRNNYIEQRRLELLKQLEPYPLLSLDEFQRFGLKEIDFRNFLIKINFTRFVSEFELKNGDILNWGNLLNPDVKIERLKAALEQWAESLDTIKNNPNGQNSTDQKGLGRGGLREPGQRTEVPT